MRSVYKAGVVVTLMLALAAAACASDVVTVTDSTGRSIAVPQPVLRIASPYGIGTYFIYALGAGDRLVAAWYVGVKSASQAPSSLQTIEPRLAELIGVGDPNVEELAARDVDLVVADASKHTAFASQMEELGVPTLLFGPETPQGVVDTALALGTALGERAAGRAALLAADFWRVYATALAAPAAVLASERPSVLFLGSSPLRVASGSMYQTSLIAAAGGFSVSADLAGSWNEVNLEQVIAWNPDVIIIPPYATFAAVDLLTNPDWQSVRAVASGRVFKMPRVFAPMDTPLPESLLGVVWLSSVFYPELGAFDVPAEAAAFYETYYGYALSASEEAAFLVP